MMGDWIMGEDVECVGLVNFFVEDDDILEKVLEIVDCLVKGFGFVILVLKVGIN